VEFNVTAPTVPTYKKSIFSTLSWASYALFPGPVLFKKNSPAWEQPSAYLVGAAAKLVQVRHLPFRWLVVEGELTKYSTVHYISPEPRFDRTGMGTLSSVVKLIGDVVDI
jgi:hypothetical protein